MQWATVFGHLTLVASVMHLAAVVQYKGFDVLWSSDATVLSPCSPTHVPYIPVAYGLQSYAYAVWLQHELNNCFITACWLDWYEHAQ